MYIVERETQEGFNRFNSANRLVSGVPVKQIMQEKLQIHTEYFGAVVTRAKTRQE